MGRRKRKRIMSRMSIIYMASIVSLSLMGIGYGYWNNELNLGVSITTGKINPQVRVNNYDNGSLDFILSEDDRVVYITGQIYWNSSEDISIKIIDNGSIPVILEDISVVSTSEIVDLNKQSRPRYGLSSFTNDDVLEIFELSITPTIDDNEYIMMQRSIFSIQESLQEDDKIQSKINAIQQEINEIQNEIDRLNIIEHHKFRYDLRFMQGI